MKKRTEFDYDKETGLTIARLKTSKGTFFGCANIHPDDPLPPSYSVGMSIAEARANINLINHQMKEKRCEIKAMDRLLKSIPETALNRFYAENLREAMVKELDNLKADKQAIKEVIFTTIESRKLYIKSRTMDKKARDESLAKLGEAIKQLDQVKND